MVPVVNNQAFLAPSATLCKTLVQIWIAGEVYISNHAAIGYGVTVYGDHQPVRIGEFSSIGDMTSINTLTSLGLGVPSSVNMGKNVVIGNHCSLWSCIIDDECFVSPGCIILEGSRLERGCMIGPYSVVPPGSLIPAGQYWAGNPARYVRNLDPEDIKANYNYSYRVIDQGALHIAQVVEAIKAADSPPPPSLPNPDLKPNIKASNTQTSPPSPTTKQNGKAA